MKNFKKIISFLICALIIFTLTACGDSKSTSKGLTDISICLDWTPNTNHTGLYVALQKGYYENVGLNVNIIQPPENGAAEICALGQVQFAVDAQDTLAPALARENPLEVTAIAAIIQHNTSGIISKQGEGMYRPAGLEGKEYLTWQIPTELAIMENVVTADGGDWSEVKQIPNTVSNEAMDISLNPSHAIWVFYGWSGINAEVSDVNTDFFYFRDINSVFDYYTPVIICNNSFMEENPDIVKVFLSATEKGYRYAIDNPEEAAEILIEGDETGSLKGCEELVIESQKWLSKEYIADSDKWGYINPIRWDGFYQWLYEEKLIDIYLPAGTGYTNNYLS